MRVGVLGVTFPLLVVMLGIGPVVAAQQQHGQHGQEKPAAEKAADTKAAAEKGPDRKKPENQPGSVMNAEQLAASHAGHHEMAVLDGGGVLPDGWQHRFDLSEMKLEHLRFKEHGGATLHVTSGPPGIYWNPTRTARGSYAVRATFTQLSKGKHREGYGLLVGGADLPGATQRYTYFLVRQDGKFLIKQRDGVNTRGVVDWTTHAAVKPFGADGKMTNELSILAGEDTVRFLLNGIEVARKPRQDLYTDGIVGLRVNHQLDVQVDGLTVEPVTATSR